ncbi:MAG: hypothetical protein GY707_16110, partial [Desulfobacteraceae bacterium]|nr:hypothetical protein [Desulfobacteraceae bacterium]
FNIEQNGQPDENIAVSSKKLQNNNKDDLAAKQLDLFNNNGNELIQMINKIDISSITPIEALNLLNDLQQKVKP